MIGILHITPDFNYSCGRSKLVYLYLKYFSDNKNYVTHFITNGGDSLDRLKELTGLHYKKINFSTGFKNIFYAGSFIKNLQDYIEINNIEIVHTHHRFPEVIANLLAKRLGIKTIFSTHGFVHGFKKLSHKSNRIISASNSVTLSLIEEFKVRSEKIITLYNPNQQLQLLELSEIQSLKNKLGLPNKHKILLFMGRINKDKGCDNLIDAFNLVRNKNFDVTLLMSGNIEDKKLSYKLRKISDKINFLTPSSESIYLYQIADVVLLPSKNESFPYVMLESGNFKKPFIGGNTGGISEFIEDGLNGLLVDPENPQELAEKIIYLLKNPDIGKTLGENLHNKVNKLCDFNNYFSKVEKIYYSLLFS